MKRRIFLYNTVAVLTALIALLAVNGLVTRWITDRYLEQGQDWMEDRLSQVQGILTQWEPASDTWDDLDEQLRALECGLHVAVRGHEIYSSLDPGQTELLRRMVSTGWMEDVATSVRSDGVMMVGVEKDPYTIIAMPQPEFPEIMGGHRPQSEATMLGLTASGLAAIVVIVLLNLAFTRYQVKQLLQPVEELTEAAQRVERGELSQPLNYGKQDEFTAVFTAFDHMQEHLLAEREKNAAYERARTDLVSGISHDLRTPLTSVKGYLKGLRDGVANTPEKQRQYVDIAYRKACDMDVLLQRLFYFSKMETGALPIFLERADLGEFVRKFAVEAGRELAEKGGTVTVKGAPAPHPVRIDTEQMVRVLSNLTNNAVQYAGAEPLTLTLTVWRERDRERLRFADNGRGVPEDQLPHLFEQFWRGDQARTSRGGEGSGLGLYIVKYIIEAHGGTVTARNDHGLVFEIALPCDEEGL